MPRRRVHADAPESQQSIRSDAHSPDVDDVVALAAYIQGLLQITGPYTPPGMIGPDGMIRMECHDLQWCGTVQVRANAIGQALKPFGHIDERREDWRRTHGWPPSVRDAAMRAGATLRRFTRRWGLPEALRGEMKAPRIRGTENSPEPGERGEIHVHGEIPRAEVPEDGIPRVPATILTPEEWKTLEWCLSTLVAPLVPLGRAEFKLEQLPYDTPTEGDTMSRYAASPPLHIAARALEYGEFAVALGHILKRAVEKRSPDSEETRGTIAGAASRFRSQCGLFVDFPDTHGLPGTLWDDFAEEHPEIAQKINSLSDAALKAMDVAQRMTDSKGPVDPRSWAWLDRLEFAVESLRKVLASNSRDATGEIPAERRTRSLTLGEAGVLMGLGTKRDAAGRALRSLMNNNGCRFKELSRQRFVFDINDFPRSVHDRLIPQDPDDPD